jgi:hypothetical protein
MVLKNPPRKGEGFEKPHSRGGKGFEKVVRKGSLGFENRQQDDRIGNSLKTHPRIQVDIITIDVCKSVKQMSLVSTARLRGAEATGWLRRGLASPPRRSRRNESASTGPSEQ